VNVERDILQGLTYKQFVRWQHYAQVEPFNFDLEKRADYRAAQIAQMLYNVNRGKGVSALKLEDAVLDFEKDAKKPPSQKELMNKLMFMAKMQALAVEQGAD